MSIVNFAVLDDHRAVVAVDTTTVALAPHPTPGVQWRRSKLHPFMHMGAVLAGHGRTDVLQQMVFLMNGYTGFDDAARDLGNCLEAARQNILAHETYRGMDLGPQRALLVGYSQEHGRMVGVAAHLSSWAADVEVKVLGSLVAPDHEAGALVRAAMMSDSGVLGLMRQQYGAAVAAGKAGEGFGGHAIVARLTAGPRPEIVLRDLGAL